MKPSLGWVLLSRDALSRAETQLREDIMGVRDEIGFLLIHSGYANRFFPGTSVLHTRLRYVLFIPWMYQDLLGDGLRGDISDRVSQFETNLAGRLRNLSGAIGGKNYPLPTSQPPTFAYWTALRTWGVLRHRMDGSCPTKAQLYRNIRNRRTPLHLTDDDNAALDEAHDFFAQIPQAPEEWYEQKRELTFELRREEQLLIRKQLVGVMRSGDSCKPSLLSLLAENIAELEIVNADFPWSPSIYRFALAEDRFALQRARSVAALSDIGRAVYNALVETLRDREDGLPTNSIHRDYLPVVLRRSSADARMLNITDMLEDIGALPDYLVNVLEATVKWLSSPDDPVDLLDVYTCAELTRKDRRTRLTLRLSGKERRAEWRSEDQTKASPITYRWQKIRQLLSDLKGEA